MIVCPQCSKENQDHYKFCLGCGSDLPRNETASTGTPPAGVAAAKAPVEEASAADTGESEVIQAAQADTQQSAAMTEPAPSPAPEPAPEPAPAPAPQPEAQAAPAAGGEKCSSCGSDIPDGFAFCGSCGTPIGGGAPVSTPAQDAAPSAATGAAIILIQPDGSEGGMVEVPENEVLVGRDAGGFFETDAYLSPQHAVLRKQGNQVFIRDENSLNGIFKKVAPDSPLEIESGAIFRIGQELIQFEEIDNGSEGPDSTKRMGSPIEGLWGRLCLIVGEGRWGNTFPLGGEDVICGRERGNILFPDDGYISGVHLRVHHEGGKYFLTDLGSSNGTYIKLNQETALNNGEFVLMGAQLFRVQV